MALFPLSSNREPYGHFDLKDGTTILGGECVTLSAVTWNSSTDLAAADVTNDGYAGTSSKTRPAVSLATTGTVVPIFLADEGTSFYGTLFGTLVGSNVGQTVTGGTVLGPATYAGSGKCTVWHGPGLYGVSLDALNANLNPTVATAIGTVLNFDNTGKLCLAADKVSSAPTVAYFEEYATNGSLVNTPRDLVAALNSPSGSVSSTATKQFTMAVVHFIGA